MDRISKSTRFHRTMCIPVAFGTLDSVPIDQQAVKGFNIDPMTGRPIYDMTAIIRSQGLEQQRLLADLSEFKAQFLPDDISDADALKYLKPRLCQMPSEMAEYQEMVVKARLQEKEEIARKEEEEKAAKEYEELLEAAKKRTSKQSDDDETKE